MVRNNCYQLSRFGVKIIFSDICYRHMVTIPSIRVLCLLIFMTLIAMLLQIYANISIIDNRKYICIYNTESEFYYNP